MKLFFLRHGQAEHNHNDDIRELTQHGRKDVKHVARSRRDALSCVQQVLVSPIVRAQQTADIACEEAHIKAPRATVDWLVHETPVREALAALATLDGNILLVGHQPLAGKMVESLCGLHHGASEIGTANLVEMEGEAFISGAMRITHQETP
jgi:phosphohistidine phosphatase